MEETASRATYEPSLKPEAILEAYYRTRHSDYSAETANAIRLDLERRLSRHDVLDERTICAEHQRSVLVVARGMSFS